VGGACKAAAALAGRAGAGRDDAGFATVVASFNHHQWNAQLLTERRGDKRSRTLGLLLASIYAIASVAQVVVGRLMIGWRSLPYLSIACCRSRSCFSSQEQGGGLRRMLA
jgi:hypothetical protein